MSWALLLAGGIIGGILSAYSRRDRDNVFLRIVSFIVPFACTAGFWYLEFKSGGSTGSFMKIGADNIASSIITVVFTSVLCSLISKGIGALIVTYIDTKR
ncbi:MAG: hypothetical protein IJR60_03330 [Eubacterium sp.]|nr:hypothetical protein [Eubacterium sp.]